MDLKDSNNSASNNAAAAAGGKVNIVCLKWGTAYPAFFVNRLFGGVRQHLSLPFRFVCVTDDPAGLAPGIDTAPFPGPPPGWKDTPRYQWPAIYVKLLLFEKGFANLSGPTLFLDIDQIVTGPLDDFFTFAPGRFCIIHNWIEWHKRLFRPRPFIGNSSCFRFDAGDASDYIYRRFLAEMPTAVDQRYYRTEQAYMTHAVGRENITWWPDHFVRSFKRACQRPWPLNHFLPPKFDPTTRILCFHGHPNPDEAIAGYRGKHLNTWTKPAPWVAQLWEKEEEGLQP